MIIKIDKSVISGISKAAGKLLRKRKNFNYHKEFSDPINRMLNAIEPGSYIQPHKHEDPDKREVFFLIRGRFVVVIFDDTGKITDHFILDKNLENFAAEIPARIWHTVISLESGSVVYEVKDGPYSDEDDKHFASWAPVESSLECEEYLEEILKQLEIKSF